MNTIPYSPVPFSLEEESNWHYFTEEISHDDENVARNVSSLAKLLREITAGLWHVMPPAFLAFGTFGNVMIVLTMRGMRASESTASLALFFTALAISDQIQLTVTLIFHYVQYTFYWPHAFFRFNLLCPIPKFTWNVCGVASAWFLIAMTYQRVTSVVLPHRVTVLCTSKRAKIIVALITLVSCAFNSHFFVTWAYYPEFRDCHFRKEYEYLINAFEVQDMLCVSIFPFILLLIGNSILIYHVIKAVRLSGKMRGGAVEQNKASSESGKVYSMSITLIVTSTAYLFFTIPDSIFDISVQMSYMDPSNPEHNAIVNLLMTVALTFLMCSISTNFYLYLLTGKRFREEAKRILCRRENE